MTYFEVTGWKMPTLVEASARVSSLLKELSDPVGGYAVEVHCRDVHDLKPIVDEVPSSRSGCACYCWKPIADGSELRLESFSALRRARLIFGGSKVYIDADQDLPPYDWGGSPSVYSIVRLTIFNPEPLKSEDRVPSPTTIGLLTTITNEIAGEILEPVGVLGLTRFDGHLGRRGAIKESTHEQA